MCSVVYTVSDVCALFQLLHMIIESFLHLIMNITCTWILLSDKNNELYILFKIALIVICVYTKNIYITDI